MFYFLYYELENKNFKNNFSQVYEIQAKLKEKLNFESGVFFYVNKNKFSSSVCWIFLFFFFRFIIIIFFFVDVHHIRCVNL